MRLGPERLQKVRVICLVCGVVRSPPVSPPPDGSLDGGRCGAAGSSFSISVDEEGVNTAGSGINAVVFCRRKPPLNGR